jgi:hypothetical protein
MTPPSASLPELRALLALVEEALAESDRLGLDAIGIALDTARISLEDACADGGGTALRAVRSE